MVVDNIPQQTGRLLAAPAVTAWILFCSDGVSNRSTSISGTRVKFYLKDYGKSYGSMDDKIHLHSSLQQEIVIFLRAEGAAGDVRELDHM